MIVALGWMALLGWMLFKTTRTRAQLAQAPAPERTRLKLQLVRWAGASVLMLIIGLLGLVKLQPQSETTFTMTRQSFDTPVYSTEKTRVEIPTSHYSPDLDASQQQWDRARGGGDQ